MQLNGLILIDKIIKRKRFDEGSHQLLNIHNLFKTAICSHNGKMLSDHFTNNFTTKNL